MRIFSRFCIFLVCFLSVANLFSQTICGPTALTLTPGTPQCGTNNNVGSFPDAGGAPTNPCNTFYNDGEYWFKYVGTGMGLQLDVTGLTATYSGLYVLDACPGAAPTCIASYSSGASTANFSVLTPALTLGVTYYIVMANWSAPYSTNFCLSSTVVVPPVPPANDNCGGATLLTVNPDFSCATVTAGTINLATASPDANTCGGTDDDDVWFRFVATNTSHKIDLLNVVGSTTDLYHAVFTGACGALGAPLLCSDPNSSTVTGLTPGITYYVRVYSWTATGGQTTTFNICIGTPPPPPANDNCGAAILLTVNPNRACGTVTAGTIASATASPDANACGGTDDDDVWFRFVATASTHYVDLLNVVGSTTDLYHAVFTGACGALGAPLFCSDPNSSTLTGLIPGNTYYVRIYTWTATAGQTTSFNVCIGTDAAPTCSDGIQNQGETGVDCGGPCPAICPPTIIPIVCTTATFNLTAGQQKVFYDDGGPGGDPCADPGVGNYCNCNCFTITTICAAPGEYVIIDFREFAMWNTTTGWDWMKIYDNNTTSGTILYNNFAGAVNNPQGDCGIGTPFSICSSGQCLTFEFWATSVVNRAGWDGLVSSVPVACTPLLPIELLSFTGNAESKGNRLDWTSISEENGSHFGVERLNDLGEFTQIGTVACEGGNGGNTNHSFLDENVMAAKSNYRLKKVDLDGKYAFSSIVEIIRDVPSQMVVYPNPTSGALNISLKDSYVGNFSIMISDVYGKMFEKKISLESGVNVINLPEFHDFAPGVYVVKVEEEGNGVVHVAKVVKVGRD